MPQDLHFVQQPSSQLFLIASWSQVEVPFLEGFLFLRLLAFLSSPKKFLKPTCCSAMFCDP